MTITYKEKQLKKVDLRFARTCLCSPGGFRAGRNERTKREGGHRVKGGGSGSERDFGYSAAPKDHCSTKPSVRHTFFPRLVVKNSPSANWGSRGRGASWYLAAHASPSPAMGPSGHNVSLEGGHLRGSKLGGQATDFVLLVIEKIRVALNP